MTPLSPQKFGFQFTGDYETHEEYENYRLVVEFRWGTVTWNPRTARARDSGVLIHCQGPDGNTGKTFNGPWMRSIEAQMTHRLTACSSIRRAPGSALCRRGPICAGA